MKPDSSVISLFGLLPWKWDFARCGRTMQPEPLNPGSTPDVVIHRHPFVSIERAIEFHACGPTANYFEPRRAP
ncbi:hypothetical protein DIE10_06055 [Burkholderia sp. Bp9011]|nr:hypothetical protein DIE10_06055 [Burkholderia sp. Bp9011]